MIKRYILALLSLMLIVNQAMPIVVSAQIEDDIEENGNTFAYALKVSNKKYKTCTYYPEDNKVSCIVKPKTVKPNAWEKMNVITTADKPHSTQNVIGTYTEPVSKTTMYVIQDTTQNQ
jgi:hypothetical protein